MMVLTPQTFPQALQEIDFTGEVLELPVHVQETSRVLENSDAILEVYGKAKWHIIDVVNARYAHILRQPFDLHHWLARDESDELAYFLNEAGSNALNHSQFKAPSWFWLWFGTKGFVVGIEQKGEGGFTVPEKAGGGFMFFQKCNNVIFTSVDSKQKTSTVFLEYRFSQSPS